MNAGDRRGFVGGPTQTSSSPFDAGRRQTSDRSKKHLSVTFSSVRVGVQEHADGDEDDDGASILTKSNGRKRATNGGSAGVVDGGGDSRSKSYDNYAGPSAAVYGGGNNQNDLRRFLHDDSIWRDLTVDFSNANDTCTLSEDLLETSASSSIISGSERSWASAASVRSRVEKFRTKCQPTWASIKTFVLVICVLIVVHGALATGYTMSVITTIEKRFEISSKTSGLIVSSYEFGSLLSVIFVSYFGSNGHIPRVVGLGGLILAMGSLLFSLPHFIAPMYVPANSSKSGPLEVCTIIDNRSSVIAVAATKRDGCGDENRGYVVVLMMAQVLLGIGGTPLFTLGTTYIDNHVDKENASVYLAFMYVCMALGPVLGFLLGALLLSEYVNATVPDWLTTSSPEWIGLWWGGFIVCGILYFISSTPFFFFPRRLPTRHVSEKQSEYGRSWKKIPVSILKLLTNSVYMMATFNACIELAIVTGFTVFLPKYLETQFRVSTSNASVLTGAVAVPGACIGIFFGGWVMKKLKLELDGVAKLVVLVNLVALSMMTGFFFFGCGTLEIAGVTSPYRGAGSVVTSGPYNLTDPCNLNCHCSMSALQPICGVDKLTYLSPCFAGCTKATPDRRPKSSFVGDVLQTHYAFQSCSCIQTEQSQNVTPTPTIAATDGICEDECGMLVPFMILVFVLSLAASNNQMPLVMVTLRSVAEEEKAFALGVQVVILRLLSYIPSPIIYGDVIDSTCVVWNKKCGMDQKNCLFYNISGFRIRFASLSMGLMVAGVALSFLLWFCIHKRYTPFSPPITMSEIAHRFGDFDNLHIVTGKNGLRSWVSDDSLYSRPHTPRHQKTRSC